MAWSGISRNKIRKSVKKLEALGFIRRWKVGRAVHYQVSWIGSPGSIKQNRICSQGALTVLSGSPVLCSQGAPNKTKEKEQRKSEGVSVSETTEEGTKNGIEMVRKAMYGL